MPSPYLADTLSVLCFLENISDQQLVREASLDAMVLSSQNEFQSHRIVEEVASRLCVTLSG